jgi:predicted aminopeptidase
LSIVLLAVPVLVGGCRAGYLARVGIQQLRYLHRAVPIKKAIESTTDPVKREKLRLVLAARDFAAANGLKVGGSYEKISDTTGLAVGYVVTAAYADRLEPYEWSYPVVGSIPYRGYFERDKAEAFAAKLRAQGLDTYIVEAAGYSTLGWFDDPLPSGMLEMDEVELATTVFHELTHSTLFVPGHIAFNETLASAVGQRMAIAFFDARADRERAATARERHERWLAQSALLDRLARRLELFFARAKEQGLDHDALLAGRRRIYEGALDELVTLGLVGGKDPASAIDRINNAVFLALYRYRERAGDFERYLAFFPDTAEALRKLAERVKETEDPYTALEALPLQTTTLLPNQGGSSLEAS